MVARFIPMARVLIPVIAGIGRMNYYKFFSANLVGAIVWGVGLSLAGYYAASIPLVKDATYMLAVLVIGASLGAGIRSWFKNNESKSAA